MTAEDRSAPEGAECALHDGRPALAKCPRCHRTVCISCWHLSVDRCARCVAEDPTAGLPPVPFESVGGVRGFVRTLGTAFRPISSAPRFASSGLARPIVFALLTALPLAALRGVIPYTHLLVFGTGLSVEVREGATSAAIAADVAQAAGISVLEVLAYFLALTLPFASLSRAFGTIKSHRAATRTMLYRAWLLPFSIQGLFFYVGVFVLPEAAAEYAMPAFAMLELLPLLLLFMAMRATSRIPHGTGVLASFGALLVPLILLVLTQQILSGALAPWLPASQSS